MKPLFKPLNPFVHIDKRRILREFLSGVLIKNIKVLHLNRDSVLGNHFSLTATEYFYIAKGYATLTLVNITTGDKQIVELKEGDAIVIPPQIAHSFEMKEGSILIEAMNKIYNPAEEVPYETK
jgi:mannose-6-phosphate isomerase-like protein (cupin superfamily)